MSGELPGSCGVPILGLLLGIGATACSPAERPGAPTESFAEVLLKVLPDEEQPPAVLVLRG